MADDTESRIYSDLNRYIFDWLVAKPADREIKPIDDGENRINTMMAMLSRDRGGGNVLPFKSRKK